MKNRTNPYIVKRLRNKSESYVERYVIYKNISDGI
jgi:hypothetical protein